MSFGSTPAPAPIQKLPDPAPVPPKRTDPEIEDARRKELELQRKAKGRRSTILTGTRGVQDAAPVQRKRLLGG